MTIIMKDIKLSESWKVGNEAIICIDFVNTCKV